MVNLIEEWGKWARHHKDDLASQSAWLSVMRNNVALNQHINYYITDDQALLIDKAVCKLAKHSTVLLNVLCYRYLAGWSMREIAKNYLTILEYGANTGKKQVQVYDAKALLNRAEGFILGSIETA